jgi:hypothetical protein
MGTLLRIRHRTFGVWLLRMNDQAHRAEFLAAHLAFLGVKVAHCAAAIGAGRACVSAASLAFSISNISAQDDLTSIHDGLDVKPVLWVPEKIVPEYVFGHEP